MTQRSDARHRLRQTAALLSGLCVAYLASGCAVEPPSAPSTEFVISIPVANDSTQIADIVGDRSDFLQIDQETGGMNIRFSREVGRADVGDRLQVRPTANSFGTQIGNINIPGQQVPPISVALGEILGQDIESGVTLPVLPASEIDVSTDVSLENVTSLTIVEGSLNMAVSNGLPIALDGLRLSLVDLGNGGEVVDTIDLGQIEANGGSSSGAFSLSDKSISGSLAIAVSGSTVEGTDVAISGNPSLDIEAELSDLVVSQAFAVIPEQNFSDSQVLAFPDDRIQVTRAVIQEGGLVLRVTNEIEIVMAIELRLDDLRDPNGDVNVFRVDQLTPGEVKEVRFDLNNNEFSPVDPLELRLSYTVNTFSSDRPLQIFSTGELKVEAITEDLIFDRVEGRLNRISLDLPTVDRSVDFPDGLNNVAIGETALDIFVTSAVGFLADVELLVSGTNSFGERGEIVVEERFERGNAVNPVSTQLSISPRDLTDFLNLLPTDIEISSSISIGDGAEEESITQAQWVSIDSVVFRTSPRLTLLNDTQIEPEARDITFRDSELRSKILSNFVGARVITDLENSIPLGVGVRLYVGRTPETVYSDPIITVPKADRDPFEAIAAPVDANGYSNGTETVRREIALNAEDVAKFILEDNDRGRLYSGVRVTLPSTGGEVEILGTDFINIIAGLEVELLLDDSLVE
jgi:hypothetical protein